MPRLRVYVDTSVIGGVQDSEFAEATKAFLDRVRAEGWTVLLSNATYAELEVAPARIREVLAQIPPELIESVTADEEVASLAQAYIDSGAIGASHRDDALHVAAAAVARADVIVSWNFRHIVNFVRIRRYNAVNLLRGYREVDIRSPREIGYEDPT